jgi:hypothetical protein
MLDMALALVMGLICIFVHFEALSVIVRVVGSIKSTRISLLATWTGLFFAHIVEIWIYALAYMGCAKLGIGELHGVSSWLDYGYYSSAVYTTLGFGDIVPSAGVQLLTGSEALVGLSLIAWSATVTYGRVLLHQNNDES